MKSSTFGTVNRKTVPPRPTTTPQKKQQPTWGICCLFWTLAAFVFAGVFGWAYVEWRDERSDHLDDLALERQCTRLTLLPNSTGATIVFVDSQEYQLHDSHDCYSYMQRNGVDLLDNTTHSGRRLDVSSHFLFFTFVPHRCTRSLAYSRCPHHDFICISE